MNRKFSIDVRPGFYIYLALSILLLPFKWLCAWLIAVSLHELGHVLAAKILGISIFGVTLSFFGMKLHTSYMTQRAERLCAAAGPICGGCLIFLITVYPQLAICGFVQALFNLIPIYPLDGGRIFGVHQKGNI